MKLHELLTIYELLDEQSRQKLDEITRPATITKPKVWWWRAWEAAKTTTRRMRLWWRNQIAIPETLDELTIGQVLLLSQTSDPTLAFKELLHLDDAEIALLDIQEAVGFINFVNRELKRINELLARAHAKPTPEEAEAGADQIGKDVGTFATIDYIAKRCSISHDQAAEMSWRRVYAMMVLDRDNELFRRRLQKVYQNKNK